MPVVPAPYPPSQVPGTAYSRTPAGQGEGPKPWGGRAGTAAHTSTPGTRCLSSGDGASFQNHQPSHKHSAHMASGGSQARSGALEYNSHIQPCQGCARCQGRSRTAQEQPNLGVLHNNIRGVQPLSNSEVSPEEDGQHRSSGALQAAPTISGRQQGHSSSSSLPARRRDISIQGISWVQIHSLRSHW